MARFRATIRGNRGMASRLGHTRGGIEAKVNGWSAGVSVYAESSNADDRDLFRIYLSGGSRGGDIRMIGTVSIVDGKPTFEPAPSTVGLKAVV